MHRQRLHFAGSLSVLKGAKGTGVDLSAEALAVAGRNSRELGIPAVWKRSDLFSDDQWDV